MADILIRGMEMPKDGNWKAIRIYPDGTCSVLYWQGDYKILPCTALPLPEGHGDLIDADDLDVDEVYTTEYGFQRVVWADLIDSAPTIIPASEGGGEDGK